MTSRKQRHIRHAAYVLHCVSHVTCDGYTHYDQIKEISGKENTDLL